MILRLLVFLAIAGMGWSSGATAQTTCPNGAPPSSAGICPILMQGDASCAEAARVCGFNAAQPVIFSPVTSSTISGVALRVIGSGVDLKDTQGALDQQLGRPGFDAVIAKRTNAYVYCGNDTLHDFVTAPGGQIPSRLTVCFAKSPCGLTPAEVTAACNIYNSSGVTANFLQAYKVGPIEQEVNICGCPPFVARFCELRPTVGDEDGLPRFVACNPNSSPLKAVEAEGTATIGTSTCVIRTIGGRRILIDSATGQLC